MAIEKQDTAVRVLVDIDPAAESVWEIQKSTNGGKTWITMPEDAIIVNQGQIEWDIPISINEPTAIFRLKLVTTATLRVADNTYQLPVANGQSLFMAMTSLPLIFKSQLYAGLGQFVTEINGIRKGNGLNWILFLNGQSATVGSSQVIPKAGHKIEWRLI